MQPGSWHSWCATAIKRNRFQASACTSLRLSEHGGGPAMEPLSSWLHGRD